MSFDPKDTKYGAQEPENNSEEDSELVLDDSEKSDRPTG